MSIPHFHSLPSLQGYVFLYSSRGKGGRAWKVNAICSVVYTHKVSLWDITGLRLSLLSLEFSAVAKAVWHDNVFVEVVRAHGAVALYLVQDLVDGEDGRGSLSVRRAAFGTALIGETFTCKYATVVDWRTEGTYLHSRKSKYWCQSIYTLAYKVTITNGTQFKLFFKHTVLAASKETGLFCQRFDSLIILVSNSFNYIKGESLFVHAILMNFHAFVHS